MIKKTFLAVDRQEHANKAIEMATNLASQDDAFVHLLHAVRPTKIPDEINEFIKAEGIRESTLL
jgi:hypothetical protein